MYIPQSVVHKIYLDNVSLELIDDSDVDYSTTARYEAPIITNQIGYKPDAKKIAVFRQTEGGEFSVVNAEATVYFNCLISTIDSCNGIMA